VIAGKVASQELVMNSAVPEIEVPPEVSIEVADV
jgi:hypothetical protein